MWNVLYLFCSVNFVQRQDLCVLYVHFHRICNVTALYLCCISIVFVLKLQVAMRNDTSVASNRRLDDSWMTPHICWSPPALQLKMINLSLVKFQMKPFFMMAWQRSGVQFWSALYLSSTEGMGGSWVKSWENVWRIHLEEEWGSRECFLMYPAPGNGCRQGINTDNTGGVRRLEGGREGGEGWRGVREGEGRVLNGVWRGGYLLRKGGCYSKCQLTEIEMTDFLTSSEFVVPKKVLTRR